MADSLGNADNDGNSGANYTITRVEKFLGWLKQRWGLIVIMAFFVIMFEEQKLWMKWGLWGFLGFVVLYVLLRIITNWQGYLDGVRHVETTIWGKPLDKQFWKEGEWKKTKLKLKVRKRSRTP